MQTHVRLSAENEMILALGQVNQELAVLERWLNREVNREETAPPPSSLLWTWFIENPRQPQSN